MFINFLQMRMQKKQTRQKFNDAKERSETARQKITVNVGSRKYTYIRYACEVEIICLYPHGENVLEWEFCEIWGISQTIFKVVYENLTIVQKFHV